MAEDKIKRTEIDLLATALNKIVSSEVLEKSMNGQLPLVNDLQDSNKIYYGKVSMFFVDIRESTKLPDKFSSDQLVKIYRSYIRTVVQAIRYSGGVVKDFMGDGVLAVFVDDDNDRSEDKSVRAARYIATVIDKVLNPILDEKFDYRISCGIGIHTGTISLSKVGMRGKEQQDDAENEFGIAWIGNSTNLACKFAGAVGNSTIFISTSTYVGLSDINEKQKLSSFETEKDTNILKGYIAEHYYLQLDDELAACVATNTAVPVSLSDILTEEYKKQLSDITQKATALGEKEKELQLREEKLNSQLADLNDRCKKNIADSHRLKCDRYRFLLKVLGSGHCKSAYVNAMGKDFWEEYLRELISVGLSLGKDVHSIKQEISYAMVSIYQDLGLYDKAYDFLVEQATGYSWLNLYTVQTIVRKVGYCERLKSALYARLRKHDLSDRNQEEFEAIKDWIVFEYLQ